MKGYFVVAVGVLSLYYAFLSWSGSKKDTVYVALAQYFLLLFLFYLFLYCQNN